MATLNATAVTVSWNALVIPDFSIDHYTVFYSRVESQRRRRQDGAIQFPSTATSGVIAGLVSMATYQFQVFVTGTVNGTLLEGKTSTPFSFTIDGEYHCLLPIQQFSTMYMCRGSSFFLGKVTALGELCCLALFVCLTLLASFFLPSHLSFKNMYIPILPILAIHIICTQTVIQTLLQWMEQIMERMEQIMERM